jgi:acyl-CoA reductase-like NAD-dependent aldehyde dehydrogenase
MLVTLFLMLTLDLKLSWTKHEATMSCKWTDQLAAQELPFEIIQDDAGNYVWIRHVPLGVVCGIVSWNLRLKLGERLRSCAPESLFKQDFQHLEK